LIIIAILILVLFGAKKLPTFARSLGKSMGEFKKARTEFEKELHNAQEEVSTPRSSRRRKSASRWPAWRILNWRPLAGMTRLFQRMRRVFGPAVFFVAAALLVCGRAGAPHVLLLQSQELAHDGPVRPMKTYKTLPAAPKPEDERVRVVKILAAIKPDILGVCEIGTADDLADLQKRLKAAGMDLPHTELAHGGDETRRLAIDVAAADQGAQFADRSQISDRHSDAAVSAWHSRCDDQPITPTFDLHLVGVHLKSMREITEADQAQMRRNEARLLRKHLDSIFTKEPGARILAYGDFNEHRNQPAIGEVMGSPRTSDTAMQDVWLKDKDGEVWTHFWDAADTYSRLDYCFASRLLRPHIDLAEVLHLLRP
jgi:TatA/E family protein of Tat protein translocase